MRAGWEILTWTPPHTFPQNVKKRSWPISKSRHTNLSDSPHVGSATNSNHPISFHFDTQTHTHTHTHTHTNYRYKNFTVFFSHGVFGHFTDTDCKFGPLNINMWFSMGFAGYVSVRVQLYCVGFNCLTLNVSAYMAIFRCVRHFYFISRILICS
jgi:hypothetical protein